MFGLLKRLFNLEKIGAKSFLRRKKNYNEEPVNESKNIHLSKNDWMAC